MRGLPGRPHVRRHQGDQAHNDDDDARAAAGKGVCQDARRLPGGPRRQLRQVLRGHHGCLRHRIERFVQTQRQGRLRVPRGQLQQSRRDLPASETSVALLRLSAARRQKAATTRSSSRATPTSSTSASPASIRDPHPSSPRPRARGPTLASTLRARIGRRRQGHAHRRQGLLHRAQANLHYCTMPQTTAHWIERMV